MNVVITGADGFIGRNLVVHLRDRRDLTTVPFTRSSTLQDLEAALGRADVVVHLAGANRPADEREFSSTNVGLTRRLCSAIEASGRSPQVIFSSSVQAGTDTPYGVSKREAEALLRDLEASGAVRVHLFRLPNVFGKWCRPDYNSVVATFCHNVARDVPIRTDDPAATLRLVYVDDVVSRFVGIIDAVVAGDDSADHADGAPCSIEPEYLTTVGELADRIRAFRADRLALRVGRVASGLTRALHATYLSYLPPGAFSYTLPSRTDARGTFVEMLRTRDSGQCSFFTAPPGVTRGGHYHHSKTEKFLVVRGKARFRFRRIVGDEYHEVWTSDASPEIVETVPGWCHDVTNVGDEEMVVMLWANECFDPSRPDTFACAI